MEGNRKARFLKVVALFDASIEGEREAAFRRAWGMLESENEERRGRKQAELRWGEIIVAGLEAKLGAAKADPLYGVRMKKESAPGQANPGGPGYQEYTRHDFWEGFDRSFREQQERAAAAEAERVRRRGEEELAKRKAREEERVRREEAARRRGEEAIRRRAAEDIAAARSRPQAEVDEETARYGGEGPPYTVHVNNKPGEPNPNESELERRIREEVQKAVREARERERAEHQEKARQASSAEQAYPTDELLDALLKGKGPFGRTYARNQSERVDWSARRREYATQKARTGFISIVKDRINEIYASGVPLGEEDDRFLEGIYDRYTIGLGVEERATLGRLIDKAKRWKEVMS